MSLMSNDLRYALQLSRQSVYFLHLTHARKMKRTPHNCLKCCAGNVSMYDYIVWAQFC